jgi:hypothetical protein
MPARAMPATRSMSEESCAQSATASAPPRRVSALSTAERPTSPTAMMASVRASLMVLPNLYCSAPKTLRTIAEAAPSGSLRIFFSSSATIKYRPSSAFCVT